MPERKRGRLGKPEEKFIFEHAHRIPVEEIAEKLGRTVDTIQKYMDLHVPPKPVPLEASERQAKAVEIQEIRQELMHSEAWKNLKNEFATDELRFFEEGYVKLMSQFKGDVLPSEETQIFQAIKFEILMSRNLKERKKSREEIDRLEKAQDDFLGQFGGDYSAMNDDQKQFTLSLETQLNIAKNAEQNRTNEYVKLQERHGKLMESLKGVRDKRVTQFESTKVDYLSVLKSLQRKDVQETQGRQLELMRLAGEKAYADLGKSHLYEDGNEDSPILSSETVVKDDFGGVLHNVDSLTE